MDITFNAYDLAIREKIRNMNMNSYPCGVSFEIKIPQEIMLEIEIVRFLTLIERIKKKYC